MTFIVPSRWFAGGKGLDKFREMMLKREDIVYIKHFDDASKIFGKLVDIKGGVNYFLVDEILMKFSNNIRTAIENPLKDQLRNEDNRS